MLPLSNQTVTLYRRSTVTDDKGRAQESWSKYYLTGCSWRRTVRSRMAENALLDVNEVVCRIPVGRTAPSVGDLLVRGACSEMPATAREIALLEKSGVDAFRVTSVSDNTGAPLPHFCARGG